MTAKPETLLAGTGRRCTNPPPNIAHGGWGAQKHEQAEGIDLDFWTTALALSDGRTTAVVLDIDIQILTNERADQIRATVSQATGLPVECIRACATHTHSGPVPYRSWIEKGFEMVGPWFDDLARWSAEARVDEHLAALRVPVHNPCLAVLGVTSRHLGKGCRNLGNVVERQAFRGSDHCFLRVCSGSQQERG